MITRTLAAAAVLRALLRNVAAGFRLAFFMRVRPGDLEVSWAQLVALVALDLAVTVASEVASVGLSGQFSFYNLPGALFFLPLAFLSAWALCAAARRPERTLELLIALYALGLAIGVVYALYSASYRALPVPGRWVASAVYYCFFAWLALAAALAAIRLLDMRPAMGALALVVASAVLALPMATIYRGSLWTPRYEGSYDRYQALASEDAFYRQPRILERELARLKPGRKGVIDLYFVGVAGYATQDVFMKEVGSVDRLFRERFGAEGRTVRLINNPKTLADTPIASVTALEATFARLARVMDRNEDVLFLYLTSHGSEDHQFSLEFWPMRFKPLGPDVLRRLLDDSGIKRRVVVVSACYSGGFIEALKNENTLVITASAPDRNSFGCSNEADFTYFGKAYFDEALRQTYSFVEAFEKAKPAIAAREKEKDYKGSEPQIFVGGSIVQPLAELEKRLKGGRKETR